MTLAAIPVLGQEVVLGSLTYKCTFVGPPAAWAIKSVPAVGSSSIGTGTGLKDMILYEDDAPVAGVEYLMLSATYAFTLNKITAAIASGTITVAVSRNGSTIATLNITSAGLVVSPGIAFAIGDTFAITQSAIASPVRMALQFDITRA